MELKEQIAIVEKKVVELEKQNHWMWWKFVSGYQGAEILKEWAHENNLDKACAEVIKHFDELDSYLD